MAFVYKPLASADTIRLLTIQPGAPGSPIYVLLEQTTLSECRNDIYDQYTALSYVWGEASDLRNIHLEGQPFQVTANLALALEDLRHESKTLRMWIDAICVDQSNIPERNQQVTLMKDIYSLAKQTVVYLGPADEQSNSLLQKLQSGEYLTETITSHDMDSIASVVLSRPWFERTWIFQELVLSQKVWIQIGRRRLEWESMAVILDKMKNGDDMEPTSGETLIQRGDKKLFLQRFFYMQKARHKYQLYLHKDGTRISLADLMIQRRGFKATDPRDLIYGHLAIVNPGPPRGGTDYLHVDYAQTVSEVFCDATMFFLETLQDHKFQGYSELRDASEKLRGLPSWVPDWSLPSSAYLAPLLKRPANRFPGFKRQISPDTVCIKSKGVWAFESWPAGRVKGLSNLVTDWSEPEIVAKVQKLSFELQQLNAINDSEVTCNTNFESLYRETYLLWQLKLGEGYLPDLPSSSLSQYLVNKRGISRFIRRLRTISYETKVMERLESHSTQESRSWESVHSISGNPYTTEALFGDDVEFTLMNHGFQLPGSDLLDGHLLSGRRLAVLQDEEGNTILSLVVPGNTREGDVLSRSTSYEWEKLPAFVYILRPLSMTVSLEDESIIRERLYSAEEGRPKLGIQSYSYIGESLPFSDNLIKWVELWKQQSLQNIAVVY